MARYSVETCKLCEAPIRADGFPSGTAPPLKGREGLCVTVGFSHGGWGRRENVSDWSGEVCTDCFDKAMSLAAPLVDFLYPNGGPMQRDLQIQRLLAAR